MLKLVVFYIWNNHVIFLLLNDFNFMRRKAVSGKNSYSMLVFASRWQKLVYANRLILANGVNLPTLDNSLSRGGCCDNDIQSSSHVIVLFLSVSISGGSSLTARPSPVSSAPDPALELETAPSAQTWLLGPVLILLSVLVAVKTLMHVRKQRLRLAGRRRRRRRRRADSPDLADTEFGLELALPPRGHDLPPSYEEVMKLMQEERRGAPPPPPPPPEEEVQ